MKNRLQWLWTLLPLIPMAAAAAGSATVPLRIAGSTTLFPVAEGWVAGFSSRHPEAPVELEAGGTTAGVAAVIDGGADLALASRELSAVEEARAEEAGIRLERIEVARDALAVLVHSRNPVTSLTAEQLRGIFTGELIGWESVGGPARPVTVVARNPESHTGLFFRRRIMQGRPFAESCVVVADRAEMVARVSADPWAIGFAGLADAANSQKRELVQLVRLVLGDEEMAYAISRPLFFFARTPLDSKVRQFVEFVLSPEGQALILASNFFPIESAAVESEAAEQQ